MTKKDHPYIWTEACERAFLELKTKLKTQPVLKVVEWEKPFILTTDASKYALGRFRTRNEWKKAPSGIC